MLRAERAAGQQMGRRGRRERAVGLSIFDALPALWGRRCVGIVMSGRAGGKQGGTAEKCFLSLLPPRGSKGFFIRRRFYDKTGFPMAQPYHFLNFSPHLVNFQAYPYNKLVFEHFKRTLFLL